MAVLVLLNNFLHDFSAAGWVFGAVMLWSLLRKRNLQANANIDAAGIVNTVLLLMRFCVAGIVIFGVIRVFTYRDYEWNDAAGQSQVTLLIVKHIIFTVIFVFGLIWYLKARKFVRRVRNEKAE